MRNVMRVIHWFRRDLRLLDNTALIAACTASVGDVIPLFVLDDTLLRGADVAPARVRFLLDSLQELDNALRQRGAQLVIRRGDSVTELLWAARQTDARAVYFNRDYTPLARRRDVRAEQHLRAAGYDVITHKDLLVHEPDEVYSKEGKPYTVFTPYKRAWLALPKPTPNVEDFPRLQPSLDLGALSHHLPTLHALGVASAPATLPGGESNAWQLLDNFTASGRLDAYNTQRDVLAEDVTSRLSPHLRFGTISPRLCYQRAIDTQVNPFATRRSVSPAASDVRKTGAESWISELIWREFYAQVLYHHPHADRANFNRSYDALRWGSGDAALDDQRWQAWCAGQTGYPIVDAAMRQLNTTGWMHNRARMVVASFLTKDLLLDWRLGESYFMRNLVDGDPASNNGGWQWAASTGTDAQPYFRIFNPLLQGQRFDPAGSYVRRYIPELARVPDEFIHTPSEMSLALQQQCGCKVGRDYPAPIVDHAAQKEIILQRFKEIRS